MFDRVRDCAVLEPDTESYPRRLVESFGRDPRPRLYAFGNVELLRLDLLALFSSIRTPPDLVLRSIQLARALRTRTPVIGGFQSPLERECLSLLLRGSEPIVVCLSRAIEGMRVHRGWRKALEQDRLLIVSPFAIQRRPSVRAAPLRNRVVAGLASRVMVIHGRPGSRTYRVAADALGRGTPVHCFEHRRNLELVLLGAQPTTVAELIEVL